MKPFNPGDQVKMAARLAASMSANRRGKQDWQTRMGVVHYVNSHSVWLTWSGNKTMAQLPIKAIEKV
jgi:hypothetical protein